MRETTAGARPALRNCNEVDMDDNAKEKVLALHAQGFAISQIAEELRLRADETRSIICQRWAEQKETEAIKRRLAGRPD